MTQWHVFEVRIMPTSPLSLGDESRTGNFLHTRHFITGASVGAAIANRALDACTQPAYKTRHAQCPDREQCPFWQIFCGQEALLFGYAYPGKRGPAHPFPLTARTCKYHPGYPTGGKRKPSHGVYDILVEQFVHGLLSDPRYPQRGQLQPALGKQWARLQTSPHNVCPICGAGLKPPEGTYAQSEDGTPGYAGHLSVRRATHVGINRARAVAEDSLLYTIETIDPAAQQMSFYARIVAPQDCAVTLRGYLGGPYFIGRGRSKGLGRMTFSTLQDQAVVDSAWQEQLQARLNKFDLAVRASLGRYQLPDNQVTLESPGTLFSLTLNSPAIIETFGRPLALPTPEMLGLPQAHLLQAWARTEVVTGWNTAARLPRRTRLAVQAGSVFLYWVPPEVERNMLLQQLMKIEVQGLGEERARGYGQVTVCAPFHLYNRLDQAERKE
jgi:CRISPR-associated protein Csx10